MESLKRSTLYYLNSVFVLLRAITVTPLIYTSTCWLPTTALLPTPGVGNARAKRTKSRWVKCPHVRRADSGATAGAWRQSRTAGVCLCVPDTDVLYCWFFYLIFNLPTFSVNWWDSYLIWYNPRADTAFIVYEGELELVICFDCSHSFCKMKLQELPRPTHVS